MAELSLLHLPPEIIVRILSFLTAKNVADVSCVCKLFRDLMRLEQIWERWCREDYDFTDLEGWGGTYQTVYKYVLHKFGCLLKLRTYTSDLGPYGGFFIIKLAKGYISVLEVLTPPEPLVEQPVSLHPRYTISLNETGNGAKIQCCQIPGDPHRAKGVVKIESRLSSHQLQTRLSALRSPHSQSLLVYSNMLTTTKQDADPVSLERCVTLKCLNYNPHQENFTQRFMEWLPTQTSKSPDQVFNGQDPMFHLLQQKYFITSQYNLDIKLCCLSLPEPSPEWSGPLHVLPGLYKGTYGGHGIEVILMDYVANATTGKTTLIGTKMTGDPNVPAREASIFVDLERPMVLTAEQQDSLELLQDIDVPDVSPAVLAAGLPPQPFILPSTVEDRSLKPPTTCRARYHAQGQIAYTNFNNPSKTVGHFVVFSETCFGFLWLALNSFSIYHRIHPSTLD